jgi:enoyl-CoA hydratase
MVSRITPRDELEQTTMSLAERIGQMPRFGLALAKKAVNQSEDQMGMRSGMDSVFGLHHIAHAHNAATSADYLAGQDAKSMRDANRN